MRGLQFLPLRLIEHAPGVAFLLLTALTDSQRMIGWGSCVVAALALARLHRARHSHDGIMLGINLFTLIAAPAIETLYLIGLPGLGAALADNIAAGLFAAIASTGAVLSFMHPSDFMGTKTLPNPAIRRGSWCLLVGTLVALGLALLLPEGSYWQFGAPLTGLFILRAMLVGHAQNTGAPLVVLALAAAAREAFGPVAEIAET